MMKNFLFFLLLVVLTRRWHTHADTATVNDEAVAIYNRSNPIFWNNRQKSWRKKIKRTSLDQKRLLSNSEEPRDFADNYLRRRSRKFNKMAQYCY